MGGPLTRRKKEKAGWGEDMGTEASGEPHLSSLEPTRNYGLIPTSPVPLPGQEMGLTVVTKGGTQHCGQHSESR